MEAVQNYQIYNTEISSRPSPAVQLSTVMRAQNSNGRISLPLSQPGLYMRFKYVQGVPSRRDGEGFPLYKLRMLDTLIDRLKRMKGDDGTIQSAPPSQDDDTIDFMIENYERQVRAAAAQLDAVGYGTAMGLTEAGGIVSSYM